MRTYVFTEVQLQEMVSLIAETVLNNAIIDVSVNDHVVSINNVETKITADEARQIECRLGMDGFSSVFPIVEAISYRD